MDFKEATDRAIETCVTLADIGVATGVSHQTVRRARLDPGKSAGSFRPPPDGWESAIAKLARERAAELVKLARELEGS